MKYFLNLRSNKKLWKSSRKEEPLHDNVKCFFERLSEFGRNKYLIFVVSYCMEFENIFVKKWASQINLIFRSHFRDTFIYGDEAITDISTLLAS